MIFMEHKSEETETHPHHGRYDKLRSRTHLWTLSGDDAARALGGHSGAKAHWSARSPDRQQAARGSCPVRAQRLLQQLPTPSHAAPTTSRARLLSGVCAPPSHRPLTALSVQLTTLAQSELLRSQSGERIRPLVPRGPLADPGCPGLRDAPPVPADTVPERRHGGPSPRGGLWATVLSRRSRALPGARAAPCAADTPRARRPRGHQQSPRQVTKAVVYIEEANSMADVTFPSVPRVVSLLMYDDTSRARDSAGPASGYPVVCVTVSRTWGECQGREGFGRCSPTGAAAAAAAAGRSKAGRR